MATAIKKCRVCGKEYEACHTLKTAAGVFRWQEVACSPECGSIYLARIKESRKGSQTTDTNITERKSVDIASNTSALIVDIDDNYDDIEEYELYDEIDEYFDDVEETAD